MIRRCTVSVRIIYNHNNKTSHWCSFLGLPGRRLTVGVNPSMLLSIMFDSGERVLFLNYDSEVYIFYNDFH